MVAEVRRQVADAQAPRRGCVGRGRTLDGCRASADERRIAGPREQQIVGRGVRVRQHGKGILGEIAAANVLQHFGPKGFEFVPARQVLQLGHQDVGDRQVARSQFPCPLERLDRFVQPAQFLEGQRAVRPEVGDARVQLQRLVVALERQIGAAEHAQDIAHADPHVDVAVVDGKRFFEAGQRVRHAVHQHQRLRQRGPQLGMPRRQVQPAFVAGDGLLRAFQPQQRVAAVQPGVGQAWFELQGAVEALHRFIVAAEGIQRVAAVVPDAGLVRVECQGAVEEGDGFIGTVLLRASSRRGSVSTQASSRSAGARTS